MVKSIQPGTELRVENNVGSIDIRRGPGRDCAIKVKVEAKGATPVEAEEIAKKVLIQVTPRNGRVDIGVQMPDEIGQAQRDNIQVHFDMTVRGIASSSRYRRSVTFPWLAWVKTWRRYRLGPTFGNIRVQDMQREVVLQANVGDITVVLPSNPSTRIRASAQVGGIESDLPLEITSATVVRPGQAQSALGSSAAGVRGR